MRVLVPFGQGNDVHPFTADFFRQGLQRRQGAYDMHFLSLRPRGPGNQRHEQDNYEQKFR